MKYEIHGRYITDDKRVVILELFDDAGGKQGIRNCQPLAERIITMLNTSDSL